MPDKSSIYKKAAAELGATAILKCRVMASPQAYFTWFTKNNEPIEKEIHPRYKVGTTTVSRFT